MKRLLDEAELRDIIGLAVFDMLAWCRSVNGKNASHRDAQKVAGELTSLAVNALMKVDPDEDSE
jgi:hypothetical protein